MTTILLVEDEESYREPLTYQLERDGYEVVAVDNGSDALVAYDRSVPDLVLLDLMLPGMSGTDVCRELRRQGNTPVIMLTAKDDEFDKVLGLELGADDYVTKPYSYRELVARVRAVLRRGADEPVGEDTTGVLEVGRVRMDVGRHELFVDDEPVRTPLREFELLEVLMRNVDHVLTRGQLIDRVWGADYVGDTKTLDVHVKRIRAKIEREPSDPQMLLTVRGLGYKLVAPPAGHTT
ncbi:response regulator transcription factor [Georgenia sp. H159]|uniref:response regulator transcription factor n=1 Tax=Georgenia sp. H159 TaxID=3076115 RepID=UPI002D78DF18|nr:response regulator transcription factor [Georgenia sp. H159]